MTKNYVKTYQGHAVPKGATYYNNKSGCFFNQEKTEYSPLTLSGQWFTVVGSPINDRFAKEAIELPESDEVFDIIHTEPDQPNWNEAPSDTCVWIVDNKGVNPSEWYLEEDNRGRYFRVSNPIIGYSRKASIHNAITVHKRPIAPIDKEWLPKVGEECEALDTLMAHPSYCFAKIKGFYNKQVWLTSEAGVELVLFINDLKFRPLKTAEELKRETFDNAVYKELAKIELDLDCVGDRKRKEKAIANIMFKAGFTAPKEGE